MKWPFGYSNTLSPSSSNPSLLQMAFDAAFSTEGNAWR
jgi:hypothetical protein